MAIRPFDWRDLPALHRYRRQSVFLNSALLYTRGPMMFPGAVISSLTQATGIFTSVSTRNGDTSHVLIGQAIHSPGAQIAQLTFLCPDEAMRSAALPALLDHLSVQAVERGAFRLLAEVDERSVTYEAMRQAGLAIYARQRIWQIEGQPAENVPSLSWQVATQQDLISVRSLYNNLIPGLVQQVESFPAERLHGMVFHQEGDLLAYIELKYGHRGIWAQPFVHPDAEDVLTELVAMFGHLPHRRSRPIYLCIRSYNSWIEPALEDSGAVPGSSRQAVMVRHLAVPQKAVRTYALPALEGGHAEVTAPITAPVAAPVVHTTSAQVENNGVLCHSER
jgi:hypothetical protein